MAIEEDEEKKKEKKEPIDYFIEMLKNKGKGKFGSDGTITNITRSGNCYEVTVDHGNGMTTDLGFVNGELTGVVIRGNNYFAQLDASGSVVLNGMIKDDNGEIIAAFGKHQGSDDFRFHAFSTDAEIERRKEIVGAYNAGYDFANGIYRGGYSETYDKAYDSLTKEAYA